MHGARRFEMVELLLMFKIGNLALQHTCTVG